MDKRKQTLLTIYAGVFVAGFLINVLLGGVLNPVLLIVVAQVVVLILLCYFVVFRILGKNYDASPPCAVSRYLASMSLPVRYMVAMTSSKEILRVA